MLPPRVLRSSKDFQKLGIRLPGNCSGRCFPVRVLYNVSSTSCLTTKKGSLGMKPVWEIGTLGSSRRGFPAYLGTVKALTTPAVDKTFVP